jgi:hypothetical protein
MRKLWCPVVVTAAEGMEDMAADMEAEDTEAEDTEAVGMAAVDMTTKVTWITWYWKLFKRKKNSSRIFQHAT